MQGFGGVKSRPERPRLGGCGRRGIKGNQGDRNFDVCKGNQVVQAIQVSYDISAKRTRKREINGLLPAARQTNCENLLLLTDHESEEIEVNGRHIKVQPVYEWILELDV